jgi:hypothetical protein
MTLTQSGAELEGKFSGFANGSGHWGKSGREGGSVSGTVKGAVATLEFDNGDGTKSTAKAELVEGGFKFTGNWEWFNKAGGKLGSGNWSGHR